MNISVIIPTLNEGGNLPATLASLRRQATEHELIVCDGGSTDDTLDLARAAGAITVSTAAGRGQQLAAGAARATGDVLVFLHADTVLAPGALGPTRTQGGPQWRPNASRSPFALSFLVVCIFAASS